MGPLRAAGEAWKGGLQGRTSPYPFSRSVPPPGVLSVKWWKNLEKQLRKVENQVKNWEKEGKTRLFSSCSCRQKYINNGRTSMSRIVSWRDLSFCKGGGETEWLKSSQLKWGNFTHSSQNCRGLQPQSHPLSLDTLLIYLDLSIVHCSTELKTTKVQENYIHLQLITLHEEFKNISLSSASSIMKYKTMSTQR